MWVEFAVCSLPQVLWRADGYFYLPFFTLENIGLQHRVVEHSFETPTIMIEAHNWLMATLEDSRRLSLKRHSIHRQ